MSSHDVTVAIYSGFALCAVGLQLLSLREGSRIPSFGALMARAMHTRAGRIGVIVGWAWLGLHFFAN